MLPRPPCSCHCAPLRPHGPLRSLAPLLLLALSASSGLWSCAGLDAWLKVRGAAPTLTFVRATVRGLSLDSLDLDAVFRLDNPHAASLDVTRLTYALEVDGKPLLSGAPPQGLKIAAHSSSELSFPAKVRFAALADGLALALAKKVVPWKASGEVVLDTPLGPATLPLSAQGELELPALPTFTLQAPVVEAMSIMGARIVFPIKVENPNRFPLASPHLRADVAISGTEIGTARTDSEVPLEGRGEQTLRLAVELRFLEVGAGVARSISSGEAQLKIDGAMEVGGATVPVSLEKMTRFPRVEKKSGPGLF